MLVLSRKQKEKVRVGSVIITVVRTKRGSVKLGIEAPKGVEVVREEVDLLYDEAADVRRAVETRESMENF